MPRRLLALVAVTAVAAGAVLVARRTPPTSIETGAPPARVAAGAASATGPLPAVTVPVLPARPAPDLSRAAGWINSPALGPTELAGNVVLYDFWTFECVNCQHTFPWVQAWHERYARDGLVLASIHTPEFSFEADPANVAKAVADDRLTYPVALDPDRAIWRAYGNHYWPAFYVYDRDGRFRYEHAGEGAYDTTEDVLRSLLGVDPTSPRAAVHPAP